MRVEKSHLIVTAAAILLDTPSELSTGFGILIEGEIIRSIGPLEAVMADAPGVPVLDLGDCVITPGLMNTHVHLSFSGGANPAEDYGRESASELLERSLKNAQMLLQSGVTTVRDCGSDWEILKLRELAAERRVQLPNVIFCGPPITKPGGHLSYMGGEAENADDISKIARGHLHRGVESIKVMATGGQMTPGTLPEEATYTTTELQMATRAASEAGVPSVAHVLAGEGIKRAAEAGFDSLEHCAFFERADNGLLARVYDENIAHVVVESNASVMIGVAASYRALDDARTGRDLDEAERFLLKQEERMFEIVKRFAQQHIPIVCGTDAGTKYTRFDETYLELELLVDRAGFTPLEALRTATVNAAHALRLDEIAGRIAPGYRADLIAVEGDPLASPAVFRSVSWVMRSGEIVKGKRL